MRGYGTYGLQTRITRIAEQVGGAAINGGATNFFGVGGAALAVLKAGGNTSPTAQQIAAAENQVLAVNEPAMTSTILPAIAGALWLATEAIDHFAQAPDVAAIGQGIGVPAARDLAEHVTTLVRRKLRKITASPAGTSAPGGFAGSVRALGGSRVVAPGARTGQPGARSNIVSPLPGNGRRTVPYRYSTAMEEIA